MPVKWLKKKKKKDNRMFSKARYYSAISYYIVDENWHHFLLTDNTQLLIHKIHTALVLQYCFEIFYMALVPTGTN